MGEAVFGPFLQIRAYLTVVLCGRRPQRGRGSEFQENRVLSIPYVTFGCSRSVHTLQHFRGFCTPYGTFEKCRFRNTLRHFWQKRQNPLSRKSLILGPLFGRILKAILTRIVSRPLDASKNWRGSAQRPSFCFFRYTSRTTVLMLPPAASKARRKLSI